jgi:hypothetical protein
LWWKENDLPSFERLFQRLILPFPVFLVDSWVIEHGVRGSQQHFYQAAFLLRGEVFGLLLRVVPFPLRRPEYCWWNSRLPESFF